MRKENKIDNLKNKIEDFKNNKSNDSPRWHNKKFNQEIKIREKAAY